MGERLIFVSNRLPVSVEKKKNGFQFSKSVGGLATGVGSFYKSYDSYWIGWGGIPGDGLSHEEKEEITSILQKDYRNYPLFLSKNDVRLFYYGFCNKTIWPLFHYFPTYTKYEREFWDAYVKANKKYRDAVLEIANPEDLIWIHDYHLMLLPLMLREKIPGARIGFFLHIPFPSYEIFQLLPWRKEILEGILGADLVGFHTYDYVRHFLSSVRRLLGYEHTLGQIYTHDRVIKADVFPMGIDFNLYSEAHKKTKVQEEMKKLKKKVGDKKIIISIDRLDYTKGIINRLEAFDLFLRTYSHYQGKVTMILVAVPSRTAVETYMDLKMELDQIIGKINGKYSTIDWIPVWYLYKSLPFETISALYYMADVALVTPLRDGMNLISKEFIAAKSDKCGALILSGMAGAVHELGEAIIVNPHNREQVAEAIKDALEMELEEQIENNRIMQERLRRYNIIRWAKDFFEKLNNLHEEQRYLYERRLSEEVKQRLIEDYRKASKRILLLDYDGTLVHFSLKPKRTKPDDDILFIIKKLVEDHKNEVILLSGRDKQTLTSWFGDLNVSLVAEHGVWYREKHDNWKQTKPLRGEWKEEIKPVIELYTDRTPGSYMEEKEYSIAFHFRKTEPDLSQVRVSELKETLLNLSENLNLGILEGNKVLEIKDAGINKGNAILHLLNRERWEFILAAGDDLSDEDVFSVLPPSSYSIKVGHGVTKAQYSVPNIMEIRSLLSQLV